MKKKKLSNFQKVVMSKPVGKVLDSSVGKKMVKAGGIVKKVAAAPFKFVGAGIEKEMRNQKAQDDKYRAEAPRGAIGGAALAPGELYNKYKKDEKKYKMSKKNIKGVSSRGLMPKKPMVKAKKKISSKKKSEFAPAKLPMKGDMAYKKGKSNCK